MSELAPYRTPGCDRCRQPFPRGSGVNKPHSRAALFSGPMFPTRFTTVVGEQLIGQRYSKRRISTGKMRAAERAGKIVAAMLIISAAAAIHMASSAFAWNGT